MNISTEKLVLLQHNPFWGNYGNQFDNFFNTYNQNFINAMKTTSLGSGVVVSGDGLIITNAHVVHMASRVFVTLQDGQTLEASLLGTDNDDDLALLQISPPSPIKPVPLSDDILLGETVIAIGNPLGLNGSVSSGIVSGTGRSFNAGTGNHSFTDLIQTDASINPGSSGGALLNLEGRLLGINLAVFQNAQNIGFAVPASKIKKMLAEYEKVKEKFKKKDVPIKN